MEPVFGADLAKAEKQKFADQLRARPYEYVAQEQVALSTAPVWDHGRLYSRSLVLRTYVLNTGSGWIAMPGGWCAWREQRAGCLHAARRP